MSTIEKKAVKVGKYVNTEHVDNLIRNYKKDRWMQNSEKLGKEDTLGIWFSAEELEEFIQTARLQGADGIRLCFGVYGEDAPRAGMEGRQTVALVATCSEEGSSEAAPVYNDLYVDRNGKSGILAYNQGFPFGIPPSGPTKPLLVTMGGDSLGSLMIAGKDGLSVI